ncbi:MAG TPA: hypothetical protein VGH42_01115 [Verrucomicrobiae bacterium]
MTPIGSRRTRLRLSGVHQLVDVELRAEYEMSEGVEVKYGLQQRTIRGFKELQKIWNKEGGGQWHNLDDAQRAIKLKGGSRGG